MSILSGKKILLGITAGIAAYKTAHLVRLFVKSGAEVKVVMSPRSIDFITPLTLSTLSNNPVVWDFINENPEEELWQSHVDLGLWADYFVVAPTTANTLSKMVKGTADNLLLATYLSAKCPVYLAPSMDLDMFKHPSTQNNIKTLEEYGHAIIPPESGELASGLIGEGRMAEPENIVNFIEQHIIKGLPLYGKKVLVTAGPTYEPIDPVRFIGNHSSGKMGFELAKEASRLGAEVTLISGPSFEDCELLPIIRVNVKTAEEMYQSVFRCYAETDIAIAAAAVSDYKPVKQLPQKLKKDNNTWELALEKTKDILAEMGKCKQGQYLLGFALETENELDNAKKKLKSKNLDAIVLNSLNDKGAGFGVDTNKVSFINHEFNIETIPLSSKKQVAKDIFSEILKQYCA